jgi:cytochrome c-550 PedF
MRITKFVGAALVLSSLACGLPSNLSAHGDVTPQPINVKGLPVLKKDVWLSENPYRDDAKAKEKAKEIGASGYNQNCARCHGLQVISGGMAPDLRYLELGKPGDEWFMQRIRHGARKPDGSTMMPGFEGLFSQEAMWAIRTFLESEHQE